MDSSTIFPLLLYSAACVIPVLIGIGLWLDGRTAPFSRFAAVFTLKPILVIPLWFPVSALLTPLVPDHATYRIGGTIFVTAVGLTVFILWHFRQQLTDANLPTVEVLFGLDSLRWLSTLGIVTIEGGWWFFVPLSLAMPTIFAVVALRHASKIKRSSAVAR